MDQLLIFWLSSGVFFFIIEMFTATLYGLAVSIAAFVVAAYVWYTGEISVSVVQAILFAIVSSTLSYFLPKWIQSAESAPRSDNPVEKEIGNVFVLKESKGIFKVNIEGVDYLVHESCITDEFVDGKKVVLEAHTGSQVKVKLLSSVR